MKKFILLILVLIMAGLTEKAFSSVENNVHVMLTTQVINNNNNRIPNKGNRKPSSLICIVNYTSGHIEVSTPTPVISYELWDEEGETSIAVYPSDSELVQFMTGLDGVYQLRLVTDEYIYIGYIEI